MIQNHYELNVWVGKFCLLVNTTLCWALLWIRGKFFSQIILWGPPQQLKSSFYIAFYRKRVQTHSMKWMMDVANKFVNICSSPDIIIPLDRTDLDSSDRTRLLIKSCEIIPRKPALELCIQFCFIPQLNEKFCANKLMFHAIYWIAIQSAFGNLIAELIYVRPFNFFNRETRNLLLDLKLSFPLPTQSNVMDQKVTILVAPLLKNSSCDNANFSTVLANLGATDVLQAFFIMTLTLAIVGANLVVIIVINCRRYQSFIHPQVSADRRTLATRSNFHCCSLDIW